MTLTVLKSTGHIYYKMLLHWNVSAFFLLFIDWGISLGRKISHPLVVKDLPANAGDARDTGSISGLGRSPGEGNGNLLQYSCLENSVARGAWWTTVQGATKSWTWLSTQRYILIIWFKVVHVDFGHLTEVMLVQFLYHKVTTPPPFQNCFGQNSLCTGHT